MATNSTLNQDLFSNEHVMKIADRAVSKAIETHRRLGQSIVVMRDGKPTWIAAEDIPPLCPEMEKRGKRERELGETGD